MHTSRAVRSHSFSQFRGHIIPRPRKPGGACIIYNKNGRQACNAIVAKPFETLRPPCVTFRSDSCGEVCGKKFWRLFFRNPCFLQKSFSFSKVKLQGKNTNKKLIPETIHITCIIARETVNICRIYHKCTSYYNKLYLVCYKYCVSRKNHICQTLCERCYPFSSLSERKGQSNSAMRFMHSGCKWRTCQRREKIAVYWIWNITLHSCVCLRNIIALKLIFIQFWFVLLTSRFSIDCL